MSCLRFAGLILALVPFVARHVCALSAHRPPHCERITAPMCQGLGYNTTRMPNIVGHENQKKAILDLQQFEIFLPHKCSPFLRLFICSVYIPLCSEQVPEAVTACRGLCEEVKKDCFPALEAAGLSWPDNLDCSRFPEAPDLCMQQPSDDDLLLAQRNEVTPSHHINLNYATMQACPPNTLFSGNKCIPQDDDKFILEIWIAVWSILSILLLLFALLTFMVQPKRFRWPARPILYLTICGFVTSLVYFIRWMVGSLACAGNTSLSVPVNSWICIGVALLLTYCNFAYSLWWCTFSCVWYLSASKEWSTEAIEKISSRILSIIWSLSVVPIIYALLSNEIATNENTGFCEIRSNLLSISQGLIIIIGMVLAIFTSKGLKDVRKMLVCAGRSPYKLERLIYRLGIISLGVSVPLLISLLCNFYHTMHAELLKIGLKFLSIIATSFWVFSYKTFKNWNKILRPRFNVKGLRSAPVTKV